METAGQRYGKQAPIKGREIVPAYSEQNDPIEQRERQGSLAAEIHPSGRHTSFIFQFARADGFRRQFLRPFAGRSF